MFNRRAAGLALSTLGFAAASLLSLSAEAASSVYLVNNTTKPIKVQVSSTLPSQYWDKKSTVIPPFSRKEVFETNRDKGVKDGKTYTFTAKVLPQNPQTGKAYSQHTQPYELRLKLKGSTVGSHMWWTVRKQSGAHGNWTDKGQTYGSSMNIEGKPWSVTYWPEDNPGDDDVEFAIREDYPRPAGFGQKLTQEWHRSHLNVLSYNVYMRPTSLFHNGQSKRAGMIPAQLLGYDVIVLQEAFDDSVRAKLLKGLTKHGYKHHSKILGKDKGAEQDGGVIIVSRWPIVDQGQRPFGDTCSGDDCLADKGVLYVKINKKIGGKNTFFHVFGTHLNNGNWGVQKGQLAIMRQFIDSRKIPKDEGVMIAGDMNINRADKAKYNHMLSKLGAGYFGGEGLRGHPFTHDGPLNDLGDGSKSYIDYVLYSKRHLAITSASYAEVRIPRALMEWEQYAHEEEMWDLSDHYAVYGNMHFKFDPLSDWDPGIGNGGGDGGFTMCNSDADCPSEMECVKQTTNKTPKAPSKGKGKVPSKAVKGKAVKGKLRAPMARSKAAVPASKAKASKAKTSKIKFKGKVPLKIYGGVCKIPPPK